MSDMYTIKAIPTEYKGITFRSKLEADWAKFFNNLGIKYLYEPKHYTLKHGDSVTNYLPDFYLIEKESGREGARVKREGVFVEIKPLLQIDTEPVVWFEKCLSLSEQFKKDILLIRGEPKNGAYVVNLFCTSSTLCSANKDLPCIPFFLIKHFFTESAYGTSLKLSLESEPLLDSNYTKISTDFIINTSVREAYLKDKAYLGRNGIKARVGRKQVFTS